MGVNEYFKVIIVFECEVTVYNMLNVILAYPLPKLLVLLYCIIIFAATEQGCTQYWCVLDTVVYLLFYIQSTTFFHHIKVESR